MNWGCPECQVPHQMVPWFNSCIPYILTTTPEDTGNTSAFYRQRARCRSAEKRGRMGQWSEQQAKAEGMSSNPSPATYHLGDLGQVTWSLHASVSPSVYLLEFSQKSNPGLWRELIMNSIWASISSQKVLMWNKISCSGSQSQKVEVSWFNPTPQRGAQTQCRVGLTGLYQRETVSCSVSRTFMNSLFKRGYYEKLNYINSQSNEICSKQR